MKPADFRYALPRSTGEAAELLDRYRGRAAVLAGGQSLVAWMNKRTARPEVVIDLGRIDALRGVELLPSGALRIGAMTPQATLIDDPLIASSVPLLAEATSYVALPRVRERGTLGGSLMAALPGAELPTACLALDAELRLISKNTTRSIPAEDFFLGARKVAATPEELLVAIEFPHAEAEPGARDGSSFLITQPRSASPSLVAAAIRLSIDRAGVITFARVVLSGLGAVPARLRTIESALVGAEANDATASITTRNFGELEVDAATENGDMKKYMASALIRRCVQQAMQRARPPVPSAPRAERRKTAPPELTQSELYPLREKKEISIRINGASQTRTVPARMLLTDFIRDELGLSGTHVGCEEGACGACTILVDGAPATACLMLAVQADGREIQTIEGLARPDGSLSPLQTAFKEHHALQCGFCTPGMLMSLEGLRCKNPQPNEREVRDTLAGNLCRCTGYQNIIRAALSVKP